MNHINEAFFSIPIEYLQILYFELTDFIKKGLTVETDSEVEKWCASVLDKRGMNVLYEFSRYLSLLHSRSLGIIPDQFYHVIHNFLICHRKIQDLSSIRKKFFTHKPQDMIKISKYANENVVLTPKMDGVSGVLVFTHNTINMTTKKSDGEYRDISHRIPYLSCYERIKDIHDCIRNNSYHWMTEVILQGEFMVKHTTLSDEEKHRTRGISTAFVLTKENSPPEVPVDFIIFSVSVIDHRSSINNLSFVDKLEYMKDLGLDVVETSVITLTDVTSLQYWEDLRKTFTNEYTLDGLVINKIDGETLFALKFSSEFREVEVTDIIWSYKSEQFTPTIIFKTIKMGRMYERISMSNYTKLTKNHAHIGSKILITLVGESTISFVKTSDFDPNCKNYNLPPNSKVCPVSKKLLLTNASDVIDITRFTKLLDYLDIKGVGKVSIQQIFDMVTNRQNIDTVIQCLYSIQHVKMPSIILNLHNELHISHVLALVPDSVRLKPGSIADYLQNNPELLKCIETRNIDNMDLYLVPVSSSFNLVKIYSIKRRVQTFISWDIKKINISYRLNTR